MPTNGQISTRADWGIIPQTKLKRNTISHRDTFVRWLANIFNTARTAFAKRFSILGLKISLRKGALSVNSVELTY